jgi:hypothetical protein
MEKVSITFEAPKEVHEVGLCIEALLVSIANHKEGGISATEIPAIISESLMGLIAAINGVAAIPAEFKEAPVDAVVGALLPVARGVQALLK